MSFAKPYRGGAVTTPEPEKSVLRYPCSAMQCPMPGTISTENGSNLCVYHCRASTRDWPRITQALKDWGVVMYEINECRRVHTDPETAFEPKVLADLFTAAWERLAPLAPGWEEQLKPQAGSGGYKDSYRDWGLRLERFIGSQVVAQLTTRRRA